jgi:hypothetical protein
MRTNQAASSILASTAKPRLLCRNLVDGPCGGLFGEEGVVAVINAGGVYAQLFAARVGQRGEATSAVETQEATLAACIEVQAKTVADLRWPQATAIAGCDTQVRR